MAMKRNLDSANAQVRHIEDAFDHEYRHFRGRRRASTTINLNPKAQPIVPRLNLGKVELTWDALKYPESQHMRRWMSRKVYSRIPATAR
jgi:hypothetical protein